VNEDLSFGEELDRLRVTTSGVAFIYASMSLFVSSYGVRDVVVVLDDGLEGTQLFRYGGKAISARQNALITSPPGAYSDPPTAWHGELDLLFERCRIEFEGLRTVGGTATRTPPLRRFRVSSDANGADRSRKPIRTSSPEEYEFEPRRSGPDGEFARVVVSRIFVFVTVLNIFNAVIGWTSPVRYLCGLALGIAIPSWAIIGRLKLDDVALEAGLSLATSVAILIVSAQVLITIHFWHLTAFDVLLSFAVLPSLLHQSLWPLSNWRSRR
jgi:hypothetical protein